MQVLGGCIVLMKQKASFVSASFNESRYEIQGFLHTLFLENEAQTSEKKKQNSVYRVKLSPHAKIQLLLNTFKNGRKIKGSFLLWAFQLCSKFNIDSKVIVYMVSRDQI